MSSATSPSSYVSAFDCHYTEPPTPLQTLDIHLPKAYEAFRIRAGVLETCSVPSEIPSPKFWIVYIHGGAWRDPLITSRSFLPALSCLSEHSSGVAFASLNYRLAPYPSHPTHPSERDDPARNASYPAPIQDVRAAVGWLQACFGFGSHYALVGHSCGATIAFQALMSKKVHGGGEGASFSIPRAIVGINGIYNLPRLIETHSGNPAYKELVSGAFGNDVEVWKRVSPVHAQLSETQPESMFVLLCHSREDELVAFEQSENMLEKLKVEGPGRPRQEMLVLQGRHDEAWEKGDGVAQAITHLLGCSEVQFG